MKPKSVRLTNDLRIKIVQNLIAALFDERRDELKKRENAVARKVMNWVIGEKNLELMKQLPPEYFDTRHNFRITVPNTEGYELIESMDGIRVPAIYNGNYNYVELPATNGLWKEIRACAADMKKYIEEKGEVRTRTNGLLAGVNTVKALLTVWPDIEPFVPVVEEKTGLPAVQADELNVLIRRIKK